MGDVRAGLDLDVEEGIDGAAGERDARRGGLDFWEGFDFAFEERFDGGGGYLDGATFGLADAKGAAGPAPPRPDSDEQGDDGEEGDRGEDPGEDPLLRVVGLNEGLDVEVFDFEVELLVLVPGEGADAPEGGQQKQAVENKQDSPKCVQTASPGMLPQTPSSYTRPSVAGVSRLVHPIAIAYTGM